MPLTALSSRELDFLAAGWEALGFTEGFCFMAVEWLAQHMMSLDIDLGGHLIAGDNTFEEDSDFEIEDEGYCSGSGSESESESESESDVETQREAELEDLELPVQFRNEFFINWDAILDELKRHSPSRSYKSLIKRLLEAFKQVFYHVAGPDEVERFTSYMTCVDMQRTPGNYYSDERLRKRFQLKFEVNVSSGIKSGAYWDNHTGHIRVCLSAEDVMASCDHSAPTLRKVLSPARFPNVSEMPVLHHGDSGSPKEESPVPMTRVHEYRNADDHQMIFDRNHQEIKVASRNLAAIVWLADHVVQEYDPVADDYPRHVSPAACFLSRDFDYWKEHGRKLASVTFQVPTPTFIGNTPDGPYDFTRKPSTDRLLEFLRTVINEKMPSMRFSYSTTTEVLFNRRSRVASQDEDSRGPASKKRRSR